MESFSFPVVPLCTQQMKDINIKDVLCNGIFRLCNVYKGGGGYDQFPEIAYKRIGIVTDKQFVVQLQGCPLNCYYCYVTPDGVRGKARYLSAEQLINAFLTQFSVGVKVFHLMGGAPAIYMDKWHQIINRLPNGSVFHSDLMLIERDYTNLDLELLKRFNCLYAVSIKGNNAGEFFEKTGTAWQEGLFWKNFDAIVGAKLPFYVTFTDIEPTEIYKRIVNRYGWSVLRDSFTIKKVNYEALSNG